MGLILDSPQVSAIPMPAPLPAAAPSPFAAAAVSGPAAKNETLGNLLSPSQANQFLNCSARWWFKYGAGLPDPKGGSLVRGSTVHKCIEHWFKLQMAGATPEIDDIAEFYEGAWEAQAADAQFHKDDNIEDLKRSGSRGEVGSLKTGNRKRNVPLPELLV